MNITKVRASFIFSVIALPISCLNKVYFILSLHCPLSSLKKISIGKQKRRYQRGKRQEMVSSLVRASGCGHAHIFIERVFLIDFHVEDVGSIPVRDRYSLIPGHFLLVFSFLERWTCAVVIHALVIIVLLF